MGFEILYGQSGGSGSRDLQNIALYMDGFAEQLGLKGLRTDPRKMNEVAAALARPDFPHVDGVENASPFKKAANFFVWFVASRPILDELDPPLVTPEIKSIENHQNVIFAYHMAVDCLCGASLRKKDGKIVKLDGRIRVSTHYFTDFVEAFSSATPSTHFKIASLIFEQLCYKANPEASYPEVI